MGAGIYLNYMPGALPADALTSPHFAMDVGAAATCDDTNLLTRCPPLYPFSYADLHFYDMPEGPFPNAFFNGYAYPVKVDQIAHTMTVYQGVSYGFQLSVPEPGAWVLMLSGLALIAIGKRISESPAPSR